MEIILKTIRCQLYGFRLGIYRPQVQTDIVSHIVLSGIRDTPIVITRIGLYQNYGSLVDKYIGEWILANSWGHEPYYPIQLFRFYLDIMDNHDGTQTHIYSFINACRHMKQSRKNMFTLNGIHFENIHEIEQLY